jgi:hypothetical protein
MYSLIVCYSQIDQALPPGPRDGRGTRLIAIAAPVGYSCWFDAHRGSRPELDDHYRITRLVAVVHIDRLLQDSDEDGAAWLSLLGMPPTLRQQFAQLHQL